MPSKQTPAPRHPVLPLAFALAAGLFLFLVIIKLGDPVILDNVIDSGASQPKTLSDAYYLSWPWHWGVWMFIPVMATGLMAIPWNRLRFHWILALPAMWLGWEFIASIPSAGPELTRQTMEHFAVCVALFYLGFFALQGSSRTWPIWTGIALALCWVIHGGVQQHFGGLEATRRLAASPGNPLSMPPDKLNSPEFVQRLASNRIFSTYVYANAFAGGLILMLPLSMVFLWRLTKKVRLTGRLAIVVVFGTTGLACLYWSGSKAGWLVALTVGLIALWHSAMPMKCKRWLICGVLVVGVVAFAVKYAGFFHKERNSIGARFAYWRAALLVIKAHPWTGTGPGTFQIPYRQLRRPGDESTRLCHNDYLEQASDSGIPGFLAYSAMIMIVLSRLYRYSSSGSTGNWLNFAVWLGLFGLSLHSTVEFHLYIPALAWVQFFLMGWLSSLEV